MKEPNELWQAVLKDPVTGQLEAVLYADNEMALQHKLPPYVALQFGNIEYDIVPPQPIPIEAPVPKQPEPASKKSASSQKPTTPS